MRYLSSVPPRPLDVVLVGEDSSLRDSLVRALERDELIGSVRAVDHRGSTTRQDVLDANAADTVAYLRKDPGAAGIAPVVVALAVLCSAPQQV